MRQIMIEGVDVEFTQILRIARKMRRMLDDDDSAFFDAALHLQEEKDLREHDALVEWFIDHSDKDAVGAVFHMVSEKFTIPPPGHLEAGRRPFRLNPAKIPENIKFTPEEWRKVCEAFNTDPRPAR